MNFTTPQGGRQFFIDHAPRFPFAAYDYERGSRAMRKRDALDHPHMQLQPREMRASIALDLDHADTYERILNMDYLTPHLLMLNAANGHGHAIWQLAEPVTFGEKGRKGPQRMYADLCKVLNFMFGGDARFNSHLVKTPGHAGWETIERTVRTYSMAEMLEECPRGLYDQAMRHKEAKTWGEGRHDTLWEMGRRWAYGNAKRAKREGLSLERWQERVFDELMALNTFPTPLTRNHVRSLAKNVARYTWENTATLNGAVLGGEKRSLIKSWDRETITPEQAKERMSEGGRYGGAIAAPITNAIQRIKRDDRITQAIGQLALQGVPSPTQRQIAQQAGCSVDTVQRWAAGNKAGAGN